MILRNKKVNKLLKDLKIKSSNFWMNRGEKMALNLFHDMAQRVPAYKKFLKKNEIKHELVKNIEDFKKVPTIDKKNYLLKYEPEELVWDGMYKQRQWVISTTSGSTGDPFYFPRNSEQDFQYALTAELYLLTNFQVDKKSTLYIVGFPMGAWIGGLFTYEALKIISRTSNYPLSIITPGINKLEIINTIKKIGHKFDQIIIGSYAPFLKDTLEEGQRLGINWKKYNIGFIFSAEGFSEEYRDYVLQMVGKKGTITSTLNHYGTVDLGTMSYETPLSILLRRTAITKKKIYNTLFSQTYKLPTLTQYIPEHFYFETINDGLICSSHSGYPLVRYDLHDYGGIISYENIISIFKKNNIYLSDLISKSKIIHTIWQLPFVYVYERKDFSVSFFGFQIYPETIRKALWNKNFLNKITGKFTLRVNYSKNIDQYLELNIELKPHIKETKKLMFELQKVVVDYLLVENSSYRKTREEYPNRTTPRIVFWSYEDKKYFKPGTKQLWIKKNQ